MQTKWRFPKIEVFAFGFTMLLFSVQFIKNICFLSLSLSLSLSLYLIKKKIR